MQPLITVGLFLLLLTIPMTSRSESFIPPKGKTLLLIGQDRDTIANYIQATRQVPGGVMLYTSVQRAEGLTKPLNNGSGFTDGDALLSSYPNSVLQVGLYMVDILEGIALGEYDKKLEKIAYWLTDTKRPVYLRIGYEFDNPENKYEPRKYKEAFQYIVNYFRKKGVKNVSYVWHSYLGGSSQDSWMDWYPGDEYVDWFAGSIFATQLIPAAERFLKLAETHNKPFMIAESSPAGCYSVRAKLDWFNHVFDFIHNNNVTIFCYINSNWDAQPMWKSLHWGDARIEKDESIKSKWLEETSHDQYIKADPNLFSLLGH